MLKKLCSGEEYFASIQIYISAICAIDALRKIKSFIFLHLYGSSCIELVNRGVKYHFVAHFVFGLFHLIAYTLCSALLQPPLGASLI